MRNKKNIKKDNIDLTKKAEEIMRIAQEYNAEKNFLFITTFDRYIFYLKQLDRLKQEINQSEVLITKEYVKGRKNLYESPALKSFNSVGQQANNTAITLVKIINGLNKKDKTEDKQEEDPLLKALKG